MILFMTKYGASEELISLYVNLNNEISIQPIDDKSYSDLEKYLERCLKIELFKKDHYLMIPIRAYITWRTPDININNFGKILIQNELKYKLPYSPKRIDDIKNYTKLIEQGEQFPRPTLIKINNTLKQIDGTRRIIAHLLNNKNNIDINLIIYKTDMEEIKNENVFAK